ncbi:putative fungal protein [Lyophyllum shimeji]|uniref:Fungal protein n=1 Tax=Lyophyllum shimeji TaxID=47721 RepID=A0A9P3PLV4_LYOSH|nr:putative fungal protein [Lyophyllum shimeji]
MSRGDRVVASGNLSHSMRENYQQGVSEYYGKVGSVYRNPHFPGIRRCMFQWLNRWWQMESTSLSMQDEILMFDMACGRSATIAFREWWELGRKLHESLKRANYGGNALAEPPRKKTQTMPPPIPPEYPQPKIVAADPFTSVAYYERTSLPSSRLSFKDISEGSLPPLQPETSAPESSAVAYPTIDMVICSFALHLVETPSELFSLLWELSSKTRWLVVLAPHKKPEIKEGWGWCKWDIESWTSRRMTDNIPEILHERVHCRVYRSLNV